MAGTLSVSARTLPVRPTCCPLPALRAFGQLRSRPWEPLAAFPSVHDYCCRVGKQGPLLFDPTCVQQNKPHANDNRQVTVHSVKDKSRPPTVPLRC